MVNQEPDEVTVGSPDLLVGFLVKRLHSLAINYAILYEYN